MKGGGGRALRAGTSDKGAATTSSSTSSPSMIERFSGLVSARRYAQAASLLYTGVGKEQPSGGAVVPPGPGTGTSRAVVFQGDADRLLFLLRFLQQTSKGGLVRRFGAALEDRPPPAVRDQHAFEFLLWLVTGIGSSAEVVKVGIVAAIDQPTDRPTDRPKGSARAASTWLRARAVVCVRAALRFLFCVRADQTHTTPRTPPPPPPPPPPPRSQDTSPAALHRRLVSLRKRFPDRCRCQEVWNDDHVAYRCKTCGISESSCICVHCFEPEKHIGHDYRMYRSSSGGCCDCGDPQAWRVQGFCSRHTGPRDAGYDPSDELPVELRRAVSFGAWNCEVKSAKDEG